MKRFGFLKTEDGQVVPVLHAMSEAVLPRPADWPEHAQITGYWLLDRQSGWTPPPNLQAFLDAGAPLVYIGFGSMAGRNPKRLAAIVIKALQLVGQRGIIATGWGGLQPENMPESILQIESVHHDWLFPRVPVVVHHGGAGTTAAALRAGKPSVVVPFFGDQPFWGRLVHSIGAEPKPVAQKNLSDEKLAVAIEKVISDPDMQRKASGIGEKIRLEDGVGKAIALIEMM